MDRLKERKREREKEGPGRRIRAWPSIEGLLSLRWQPKLEPGSLLPQLSEWQGQGTDARPGHPYGVARPFHGEALGRFTQSLTFECKTLVRLPSSSQSGGGFSQEKNIPVAVPGMLSPGPYDHRVSFEEKWALQSLRYTWKLEISLVSCWSFSSFKNHVSIL